MHNSCEIQFENNPKKIVYAGQLIQGAVRLNLMERTNVRSVHLRINGKASACWQDGRTNYVNEEQCLDGRVDLSQETSGIMQFICFKVSFNSMKENLNILVVK